MQEKWERKEKYNTKQQQNQMKLYWQEYVFTN